VVAWPNNAASTPSTSVPTGSLGNGLHDHRRCRVHRFPSRRRPPRTGRQRPRARRPLDRLHGERPPPVRPPAVRACARAPSSITILVSKLAVEVGRPSTWPPPWGVKLIVERPLDSLLTNIRGTEILPRRSRGGRLHGPRHLDVGDLREERERTPPRELRPDPRLSCEVALVVKHIEGRRRDPRVQLLARPGHADGHRPALQHSRLAGDRHLRDGRSPVRAPRTGGRARHSVRRRGAATIILPRPRRRGRVPQAPRSSRRRGRRVQHGSEETRPRFNGSPS
jgi:hypothetical protein